MIYHKPAPWEVDILPMEFRQHRNDKFIEELKALGLPSTVTMMIDIRRRLSVGSIRFGYLYHYGPSETVMIDSDFMFSGDQRVSVNPSHRRILIIIVLELLYERAGWLDILAPRNIGAFHLDIDRRVACFNGGSPYHGGDPLSLTRYI